MTDREQHTVTPNIFRKTWKEGGRHYILEVPDWSTIDLDQVIPTIEKQFAEGRALADRIAALDRPTWEDLVDAWTPIDDRIHSIIATVHHLYTVDSLAYPGINDVNERMMELEQNYATALGTHSGLYHAYTEFKNSGSYRSRSGEQQKVIDDTIRDFELAGVGLPDEKKKELTALNESLAREHARFSKGLLLAKEEWSKLITDQTVLVGIPERTIALLRSFAEQEGQNGWMIRLLQNVYTDIMTHAEDRRLREELYRAWVTRASERGSGGGKNDNGPVALRIVELSYAIAGILGYTNVAEHSLVKKMAPTVPVVSDFLNALADRATGMARKEYDAMEEFARRELGFTSLEHWDIAFVSELMRRSLHAIDEEQIRAYFPEKKVLHGFFSLLEELFGVRVTDESEGIPRYREDVRFYMVRDEKGIVRGAFYTDLYSRLGKQDGAWMEHLVSRRVTPDGVRLPVALLNCNFTKGADDADSYLSHREVETLFHEAGHVFHYILGLANYPQVSMDNVEWDAIETPSQFLENFCWQKDDLRRLTAQRDTQEPIPDDLVDRMNGARLFQSGMHIARQLSLGIFDWELYRDHDPAHPTLLHERYREVSRHVLARPVEEWNRFPNSFGHIFGGGYAAGYYSYLWADTMQADIWEAFQGAKEQRSKIGRKYLHEILEVGANRPFMESFVAFRGRTPDSSALIRFYGLEEEIKHGKK